MDINPLGGGEAFEHGFASSPMFTGEIGARGFNPLPIERLPAGGREATPPDRAGDFSPRLERASNLRRLGFRPDVSENPSRSVAKAVTEDPRRALPARPPLTAAKVAVRAPFPCCQVRLIVRAVSARLIGAIKYFTSG